MRTRKSQEKKIQKEVRRRREHDRKMLLYSDEKLERMSFDARMALEIAELNKRMGYIREHGYCELGYVPDKESGITYLCIMFKTSMWELDGYTLKLKKGENE